jgi:ADP-heptose:LPS heptosyltransferase
MIEAFKDRLASALCSFCLAWQRPRMKRPKDLSAAKSILVVKLDAMGDFVLITPFLRELRRATPQAHITLITNPMVHTLARECPYVTETHAFAPDQPARRFSRLSAILRSAKFLRTTLKGRRYDFAIVPRTGPDYYHARLLAYLSGAPERAGFASADPPFPTTAKLTRCVSVPPSPCHEVEANFSFLRELGVSPGPAALELHCSAEEEHRLAELVAREQLDTTQPILALGAGATSPRRVWPAERFTRLAAHFIENRGWSVVVLGDEHDRSRFGTSNGRFHNLAGQLSPNQSWSLLRRMTLFVGNNSGAMHLAAAASCPCVVIQRRRHDEEDPDPDAFHRFAPFGVPSIAVYPDKETEGEAAGVPFAKVLDTVNNFFSTLDPAKSRPLKPA